MITNKRVLVTGGTGSIGKHLVKELAKYNQVYCIVRNTSNIEQIKTLENITIIYLNEDYSSLYTLLYGLEIDITFHLASMITVECNINDIDHLIQSNITFPTILFEILLQFGYKNIINISTYAEYHQEIYSPTSLYAATKKAFEDIIQYYIYAHKFSVISVHLYHVFGKDCKSFVQLLDEAARSQSKIKLSPGLQTLDLVYIDDVLSAFLQLGHQLVTSQTNQDKHYGVYTKHPLQLSEIVSTYEEINQIKLNISWGGKEYRKMEFFKQTYPFNLPPHFNCKYDLISALKKDRLRE